jgi:N-acyl-D-amino-acid deacylase
VVDAGKLRLTDRVFDVLELNEKSPPRAAVDPRWRQVTIDHLLHHTGGWDRDRSFDPMFETGKVAAFTREPSPPSSAAIIRYMLTQPLDFDPGLRSVYSNFGYCLLGRVVEAVSHEPYADHVRAHVLGPLGIREMQIGQSRLEGRLPGEVRYYTEPDATADSIFAGDLGKPVPSPYGGLNLAAMDAHGGWLASAVDLVRFVAALEENARPPLLSRTLRAHMLAAPPGRVGHRKNGRPREHYYACGWDMTRDGDGYNFWHSGFIDGTSTLLVHRSDGIAWAVLFNSSQSLEEDSLPADVIDGPLHEAINQVKSWPDSDLFPTLLGN